MNSSWLYRGIHLVLLAVLFLSGALARVSAAQAEQGPTIEQTKEIWFRTRVSRESLSWFNGIARPIDVASVDSRNLGLLDQIAVGRKQALFASAAEAEQIVPSLSGKITDVAYDLEHWAQTPADEQADPVSAVKRMRALADKYGLWLMLGPDRRFTEQYGAQMAPYADGYLFQVQRLQASPTSLLTYVSPLIQQIRAANPRIEIVVQFRTEGTADDLMAVVSALAPDIDGVSLLTNAETMNVATEVLNRLGHVALPSSTPVAQPWPSGTPAPLPQPAATLALSTALPISSELAITGLPAPVTSTPPAVSPAPRPSATGPGSLIPVTPTLPASSPAPRPSVTAPGPRTLVTSTPPAIPPTPATPALPSRRSSPPGTIVEVGLVGLALGAAGLVVYLRFRGKGYAK